MFGRSVCARLKFANIRNRVQSLNHYAINHGVQKLSSSFIHRNNEENEIKYSILAEYFTKPAQREKERDRRFAPRAEVIRLRENLIDSTN